MIVNIEEVAEYRLYLTKQIDLLYPNHDKSEAIIELLMDSFMDGIAFNQLNLKVDV